MAQELLHEPGTTYADWVLLPGRIRRNVTVDSIGLRAPLTKYSSGDKAELRISEIPEDVFTVNIPMLSAPMQAVTGPKMAIELAKLGGLGVIYCSQPIKNEAEMVRRVKGYKAGFVVPDVFGPDALIAEIDAHAKKKGYSTFPVTHNGKPDGRLLGLLTDKDYSMRHHAGVKVADRMIPLDKLTAPYENDIDGDLKRANEILEESHHGAIPIIDRSGRLKCVVFRKDIEQHRENPLELIDDKKRYKVGAAINTRDYRRRVPALLDAGADILVIDASQGFSDYQEETMRYMRKNFQDVPFIGGNVVTEEGFDFLVQNGAYGVKIGMGPGSICTTREKFRIGRAQATAVIKLDERRKDYQKETGIYMPLIADGGIVTNDNIWIAVALGADAVMCGRFFARFDESPTEVHELTEVRDGRTFTSSVKPYWGEGSERAKKWRNKRYGQAEETEGIEGWVPYEGTLAGAMPRITKSMRIAMQKSGHSNIYDLHNYSRLERESPSSVKEGRPHDVGHGVWADYSVW